MADPYAVLGVSPDATDAAIRDRYLALTREFPPEQHPDKFAAVRAAFEAIKTVEARARRRLFDRGPDDAVEQLIREVECRTPRPRTGLAKLIAAALPPK